jgi:hypothetical protein
MDINYVRDAYREWEHYLRVKVSTVHNEYPYHPRRIYHHTLSLFEKYHHKGRWTNSADICELIRISKQFSDRVAAIPYSCSVLTYARLTNEHYRFGIEARIEVNHDRYYGDSP